MRTFILVCILQSTACQGVKVGEDAAPASCTKVGDTCTYAPGKLGLCVDGNVEGNGPPKLVCQSQH